MADKQEQKQEEPEVAKILARIREALDKGFYGEITLVFNAGRIVHLKIQESIKL